MTQPRHLATGIYLRACETSDYEEALDTGGHDCLLGDQDYVVCAQLPGALDDLLAEHGHGGEQVRCFAVTHDMCVAFRPADGDDWVESTYLNLLCIFQENT